MQCAQPGSSPVRYTRHEGRHDQARGVDELPDTGRGSSSDQGYGTTLLLGAMSVFMLVGAFAWRQRRMA